VFKSFIKKKIIKSDTFTTEMKKKIPIRKKKESMESCHIELKISKWKETGSSWCCALWLVQTSKSKLKRSITGFATS
jgi:hypothetical protein